MNRWQQLRASLTRTTNVFSSPGETSPDGLLSWWQTWAGGNEGTERQLTDFESYVKAGYRQNGIVFGLILARMSLFSEGTFAFQGLTDKRILGTQALRILEEPWPNGSTGELLARMEQDVSLAGNAFVRRVEVDRLERLRPDLVDIVLSPRRSGYVGDYAYDEILGYLYWRHGRTSGKPAQLVLVDDMCHWSPIPDPLAMYRGMSWLTSVVREINADSLMTDHKGKFFTNAATPNAWVKVEAKLEPEDRERFRQELDLRYSGVDNAHKTLIIDGGADYQTVGHSFEQMSFAAVQAAGENRIAVAANVPGIVAGLKEGLQAATYSNYEQAMRRFADLYGRPQWRSVVTPLAKLVDVPAGTRLIVDSRDIAALKEGAKSRAEILKVNAESVNSLVLAGYTAESAVAAVNAGDLSLLAHTGRVPTTLQPDAGTTEGVA